MAKILIVEDEANIRMLIRYDLKLLGHHITECEDGLQAKQLLQQESFDLLLVDWMLPEINGLSLVQWCRNNHIQAVIMMLTAKDQEADIISAFEAGVDDYVTKPFSPRQLTARIQAHLRRQPSLPQQLAVGDVVIEQEQRMVKVNGRSIELTKKEYDLLEYLVLRTGKVISRDQLLNDLWDFAYDGDTRIVDVHIFKLRSKLNSQLVTIKANRGIGYSVEVIND
jgi:two-component system, OmpR family, alkaline phosphatase synthesis response regulator PhoP